MPRKGPVTKRDVLPDPVYGSKLLTRFINKIMLDGKKGVAERIVYDAFDLVRAKTGKDPLEVFDAAMQNVMPPEITPSACSCVASLTVTAGIRVEGSSLSFSNPAMSVIIIRRSAFSAPAMWAAAVSPLML